MPDGKTVVGDLISFRGLVYAPKNENEVVFLFGNEPTGWCAKIEDIREDE